jgi:hypothetical protein
MKGHGDRWYYQAFGATYGPIEGDEVVEMATGGMLTPDSLVRRESSSDWRAVSLAFPDRFKRHNRAARATEGGMRAEKRYRCPHCAEKTFRSRQLFESGPMVCPACYLSARFSPGTILLVVVTLIGPTALLLLAVFTMGFGDYLEGLGFGGRTAKGMIFASLGIGFLLNKLTVPHFARLVKS